MGGRGGAAQRRQRETAAAQGETSRSRCGRGASYGLQRERARNQPIVSRVPHRSVQKPVDDQGAKVLVKLVLDWLAANRHLDDRVLEAAKVVGAARVSSRRAAAVYGVADAAFASAVSASSCAHRSATWDSFRRRCVINRCASHVAPALSSCALAFTYKVAASLALCWRHRHLLDP